MTDFLRIASLTLVVAAAGDALAAAVAQGTAAGGRPGGEAGSPNACSLLSAAEVDRLVVRGQETHGISVVPEPMPVGSGGSVCGFGSFGQIVLFSGPQSEARFEALLKSFKRDQEKRTPVSGVGDRAYIMFPEPRDEYEDRGAYLVTQAGPHTIGISLSAWTSPLDGPMGETMKAACSDPGLKKRQKAECAELMAKKSETAESLQPAVVELAKVVVAKMR